MNWTGIKEQKSLSAARNWVGTGWQDGRSESLKEGCRTERYTGKWSLPFLGGQIYFL